MSTITAPYEFLETLRHSNGNTHETPEKGSTNTTKVLDTLMLERARTLNRSCMRQMDFLRAGTKHKDLTRHEMLEKCQGTLQQLQLVCKHFSPHTPNGYEDPEDEFADDCIATWKHEFRQLGWAYQSAEGVYGND